MEWLKARRKLLVGAAMVMTLIVAYSSKTNEPVKTFLILTSISLIVIWLEIAILRMLNRSR